MSKRGKGKSKSESEEQSVMDAFFANYGKRTTDALLAAHGVKRFVDVIARVQLFDGPTPWVESEGGEEELAAILSDEDAEGDGVMTRVLSIDEIGRDLAPLRGKIKEAVEKVAHAKEKARALEQSWSARWGDKASAKMALQDAERELAVLECKLEESK